MSNKIVKIFNKFGFALKYCLDYERLTQRELAEKLAKHDSQISKWVQNEVTPSRKTRQKINQNIILNINKSHQGWEVTNGHQKVFDEQEDINDVITDPKVACGSSDDFQRLQQEIMALQKELIECKDDFIAAQIIILELTVQNNILREFQEK